MRYKSDCRDHGHIIMNNQRAMWLKRNLVIFRLIREPWPLWWLDSMLCLVSFEFCSLNHDWWWYIYIHLYRGTSPFGHLYSRDTSIQGTQNFVPEKLSHSLCLKGQYLFSGEKGHFFWVLKPWFTCTCNFQSGDTLAIKLWLNTNLPISLSVR